jgi:hypothetical protein
MARGMRVALPRGFSLRRLVSASQRSPTPTQRVHPYPHPSTPVWCGLTIKIYIYRFLTTHSLLSPAIYYHSVAADRKVLNLVNYITVIHRELRGRVVPAVCGVLAFGRSARVTHDAQITQLAAMSTWRLPPGSSARSSCPPRCARVRSLGVGDARQAGSSDVCPLGAPRVLRAPPRCARVRSLGTTVRVTHDAQVAMVAAISSWRLPRGSSTRSSCPPQCARVWSLGAGDTRRADRAGRRRCRAAPWELHAFFVPPRCAHVWSLGAGDALPPDCAVAGDVVAAAPWELRAFFVPATK